MSNHPRNVSNNIQNIDDNKWFKKFLVTYLNSEDHHPARITKADKDFAKMLDFKGKYFPVKITHIHKIEQKHSIAINVLLLKIRKNILPMNKKKLRKKTC